MNIDEKIRIEPQCIMHDEVVSSLIAVNHMTFDGYGYTRAEDEMWDGIRSPMLRLAIELKVWGEIGQYEYYIS